MSDRRVALTNLQHKAIPQVRRKQALQLSSGLSRKDAEVSVFLVVLEHAPLRRTAEGIGRRQHLRHDSVLSVDEYFSVGKLGFGLEGLVVAVAVEAKTAAALTARSAFVTFDSASPVEN